MSIGMSMRMGQELKTEQRLTVQQRHEARLEVLKELKHAITQQLQGLAQEFSLESPEVRESIYEVVCNKLIEEVKATEENASETPSPEGEVQPKQDEVYRQILLGDQYKRIFLTLIEKHPERLIAGNILSPLFRVLSESGYFEYDKKSTTLALICEALDSPQSALEELQKLLNAIDEIKAQDKSLATKFIASYSERRHAYVYAQEFLKTIGASFAPLIQRLLQTEINGTKLLDEYLTDSCLERMLLVREVPEKISESLKSRVNQETTTNLRRNMIEKREMPERIKYFVTNSIAQMILTSLGIIDKELFSLMKGDAVKPELVDVFKKNTGKNLIEILKRHNLETEKGFRFHRYRTLNKPPTSETDNQIRDFITQTVRADQEQILEQLQLEGKFFDLLERLENPEDRDIEISNFVLYLFDADFYEFLSDLIKEKYLKELCTKQLL